MVTEPGWAATEERLGDLLGELPADAQLTLHEVARPGDGPLVQLWQHPDALHALCDGERLPAAQRERALGDLGWQPPSGSYPQWWVRLDWPAPAAGYRDLARRLVATLRDGHGLTSPD